MHRRQAAKNLLSHRLIEVEERNREFKYEENECEALVPQMKRLIGERDRDL